MPVLTQTTAIIAITVIVSFICFTNSKSKRTLIFAPLEIRKGQFYRFITHGFIHADGNHLLFNMFTLYFFGTAMEGVYTPYLDGWGFIVFYLSAIVVAIFPSYLDNYNNPNYASLGASGAVSAVLFAYILLAPWNTLYIFGVVPIPAILFAIAYVAYSAYSQKHITDNINHSAHLWGAGFGIAATILLDTSVVKRFFELLFNP